MLEPEQLDEVMEEARAEWRRAKPSRIKKLRNLLSHIGPDCADEPAEEHVEVEKTIAAPAG